MLDDLRLYYSIRSEILSDNDHEIAEHYERTRQ